MTTSSVRLRDRRGLLRHRGRQGAPRRGLPFDCFEKSDRVGGNWVFGNRNGMSSAYRSLHINTSRERMEYSDFPMPKSYPDFPHHTQIAAYFDAYVDHFGFRDRIRFETGVEHADRGEDGVWDDRRSRAASSGATTCCSSPTATTGIRAGPSRRSPAASTASRCTPTHYVDNTDFRGQERARRRDRQQRDGHRGRVELRRPQDVPLLAPRRVHPAQVPVRPAAGPDRGQRADRRAAVRLPPRACSRRMYPHRGGRDGGLRAARARPPDRRGASDDLGRLPQPHRPRRDHLEAERRRARRRACPLHRRHERADRHDRVVHRLQGHVPVLRPRASSPRPTTTCRCSGACSSPGSTTSLFIALLQPLGATMPLAEAQGRWIAEYLRGEYHLPSRAEMEQDIERERAAMFKRYVASKRHTMQVDFDDYLYDLGASAGPGAGARWRPAAAAAGRAPRGRRSRSAAPA